MCDTLAIVTADGVLFAKNSDRDANEAQCLEWHPRQTHAAGAPLDCTWITIPQVPTTHAVLISRPYWMWGVEMGTNEWGLTIGNEAVFTNQPCAVRGLTGMDLVRLALERAASAAAAVDVITGLLAAHGQGGGCGHEHRGFTYHNSFLIADPHGAVVLETAGEHWATEEVVGARNISNALSIRGFAQAHTDRLRTHVAAAAAREARVGQCASGIRRLGDLFALLRDHGQPGPVPHYRWLNGAMAAPCMHAGGVLAASQTTGSWAAHLSSDGATHFATATAAPCTGLFKPVRVDEPLDRGPQPTDRYDPRVLWWRHERLHRAAMTDPAALVERFAPERDRLEAAWLAEPPTSTEAFAEADRLLEAWTADVLAVVDGDRRPRWVRRYWSRRDRLADLPTANPPASTKAAETETATDRVAAKQL